MINQKRIRFVALVAMFSALSFGAVNLGRFVPNVNGFLSYDPKDAVIAIAGFALGPWAAAAITVIVSLVEMLTISSTGLYGLLMNCVSTLSFVLPAAILYRRDRSGKGALMALGCGIVSVSAMMVLWNYIVTPFYMDAPRAAVAKMLLPVFLPFNLVKGGLNAALAMLLYKPLITALRRMGLVARSSSHGKRFSWLFPALSVAFFLVFLFAFLILADII